MKLLCLIDRPFSGEELRNHAPQVVTCNDFQREVAVSQNIAGKQIDRVFTFDKVCLLLAPNWLILRVIWFRNTVLIVDIVTGEYKNT